MKMVSGVLLAGAALAFITPATAAVVVLGTDLGHDCYLSADSQAHPATGIVSCNKALEGPLPANDRAATFVNRGILRAAMGDTKGAITDYESAMATDPNLADAYLDRSAAMIALKDYARALNDVNRAIELKVRRMEIAYYNRAVANEALGNVQAAYDDFRAALRVEPRFTAASEQLTRFKTVTSSPGGT